MFCLEFPVGEVRYTKKFQGSEKIPPSCLDFFWNSPTLTAIPIYWSLEYLNIRPKGTNNFHHT